MKMDNPNTPLRTDQASSDSWDATLERWDDSSDDLALPIPLDIQQRLGLDENSVVDVTYSKGHLFVQKVITKTAAHGGAA